MKDRPEYAACPRCGRMTLRTDRPALNALSRTDNQTYICSECGTSEALEQFTSKEKLTRENWIVGE